MVIEEIVCTKQEVKVSFSQKSCDFHKVDFSGAVVLAFKFLFVTSTEKSSVGFQAGAPFSVTCYFGLHGQRTQSYDLQLSCGPKNVYICVCVCKYHAFMFIFQFKNF